jgi:hypothetical protein
MDGVRTLSLRTKAGHDDYLFLRDLKALPMHPYKRR